MATKEASKTSQTVQTGTTDGQTFDWDALVPAADAPAATYAVGSTYNPRTDCPAPIRQRIEESLAKSVAVIKAAKEKGTKEGSVAPQWKLQPMPNEAMAEQFVKLGRKYAGFRPDDGNELEFYVPGSPMGQITLRAATVQYVPEGHKDLTREKNPAKVAPKDVAPGWYVRYAAKPLENRNTKK